MNLTRLAFNNIKGKAFRSFVVAACALLLAAFALSTTLIMRGSETSLRLALERLGADIVVVPTSAVAKVETALLMGIPSEVWMPRTNVEKVKVVAGVQQLSPQLYLSTLKDAACCSVANMFLVVYDPATDFTLQPWLKEKLGTGLKLGEVVGGNYIFTPEGSENILLYGYFVTLKANLEPTGTGLDQTMFFTEETARDISRISQSRAVTPLNIPADSISAIMVKVAPGVDPHAVAVQIAKDIPDVTPIESPNLFKAYRQQMTGMLGTLVAILVITWLLSVVLIGLVFSMAAYERRRELGVLRALGATRNFILRSLLTEAGLLALGGGLAGGVLVAIGLYVFRKAIVDNLGITFVFPDVPGLLLQIALGLGLALISVTLAALLPAYRISHEDPAVAMRE
ncbi:MAG: FtsX-like permease family protein [Anaerolineae bacterium]